MPLRLRGLLHRAIDLIGDSRDARGKPAGVPCVQLLPDLRCALFGKPERPAVCASLRPTEEMCGADRASALSFLDQLELQTK